MTPQQLANHLRLLKAAHILQVALEVYESRLLDAVCHEQGMADAAAGSIEATVMMRHSMGDVMAVQRVELTKHQGHGHM